MSPTALLLAAVGGLCAPVPPGPTRAERDLAALERKLSGAWDGDGPCVGQLALRENGTYERRRHGPGGKTSAGTWAVRWDALPPTLAMTCTTSSDPADAGRTEEVKLLRLDEITLAYKYPEQKAPTRYTRRPK